MAGVALNITGKRQLMLDPRVVAQQNNVMKIMSQAQKVGRVMELDPRVRNRCWMQYGSVTWDEDRREVRLDYWIYDRDKELYLGVAHSSDGEHFQTPEGDMLQVIDKSVKRSLCITGDFTASERVLKPCRTEGPVAMNGKPGGPRWQKAQATSHFMKTSSGMVSAFGTKIRVLYDDKAVYVGFECPGKRKWNRRLASENYQKVEHLEVIIDPVLGRGKRDSYYFAVGCYGQKAQDRMAGSDKAGVDSEDLARLDLGLRAGHAGEGWKKKWDVSVARRTNGWSAIFKIPYSVLGLAEGQPGCAWGFNVCHNVPGRKNEYTRYTNWAGCSPHASLEKLGVLVFDEAQFKAKFPAVWQDVTRKHDVSALSGDDVCVFFDPNGPKAERYKMVCWSGGAYLYTAVSEDGLNFRTVGTAVETGNLDTRNVAFWDPLTKKYRVYTRWWFRDIPGPWIYRGVAMTESTKWAGPWAERQVVMDPRTYPGFESGDCDFYVPGVFVYENLYLALASVYYRNIEFGPLAPSLLVSTDGVHWQMVGDGVPFIERSPGQWDSGMVIPAVPPITFGDKLYLYYVARNVQHHIDKEKKVEPDSGIGLAWIPLDRFVCYYGHTRQPGDITTHSLVFEKGRGLYVNVEATSEKGELRVEVVGDKRFTAEKCQPIKGDQLSSAVEWEGASFADLKGKPLRLKFHLKGARLYAFEVK